LEKVLRKKREMKDLYVKIGSKAKDWAEVEVYTRESQTKGDLSFRMISFRFSAVNGLMTYRQTPTTYHGFLCARCKDTVFREIASGHIEVERGKGLCGMCASDERTFNAYIGHDDKGEYVWLPDAEKHKRETNASN